MDGRVRSLLGVGIVVLLAGTRQQGRHHVLYVSHRRRDGEHSVHQALSADALRIDPMLDLDRVDVVELASIPLLVEERVEPRRRGQDRTDAREEVPSLLGIPDERRRPLGVERGATDDPQRSRGLLLDDVKRQKRQLYLEYSVSSSEFS